MKTGGAVLEKQLCNLSYKPSYRFLRTIGQKGLLPKPMPGESEASFAKRSLDAVMTSHTLSAIGFSADVITKMDLLKSENTPSPALLTEIEKRCDEMSFWISALKNKIKAINKVRPSMQGSEMESVIRTLLRQEGIETKGILNGSPLSGSFPAFDFVCETKSGVTVFIEIQQTRPSKDKQKVFVKAALAHATFTHSKCLAIKDVRSERGLSIRELSKLSGVSKSMIFGIEVGRYVPSVESLEKLASALNVHPIALINVFIINPDGKILLRAGITGSNK